MNKLSSIFFALVAGVIIYIVYFYLTNKLDIMMDNDTKRTRIGAVIVILLVRKIYKILKSKYFVDDTAENQSKNNTNS
jgi:hypothetical protein